MQKKLAAILFSTRLTATLFIVFAIAMAVGTFLDSGQETSPTPYSRALIYNAWWFEAIMVLFVINFIGNIFRFKLLRKGKITTLIMHLSFILILVGAFITRYIGYEGIVEIREGETSNVLLTEKTYLNLFIDGDYFVNGQQQRRQLPLEELSLSERLDNDFQFNTDYNNIPVSITYKNYIKNAKSGLVESEEGDYYLKIVEAGDGNRHDHFVKAGEIENIHNVLFAINKPTPGAINIAYDPIKDTYDIESPFAGTFMRMADRFEGDIVKDSLQPLMLRSLYNMAGMQFVIPDPMTIGTMGIVKEDASIPTGSDALILEVASGNEVKTLELIGGKYRALNPEKIDINGMEVYAAYGSNKMELPFSITLNDFIAEKYPGTEKSYKSFKSKVTINDPDGSTLDQEIFMNNVLDKGGYRFFQSGFDPDELGTKLSVNHDQWGTWITYLGYFLLYFGLMAILFDRGSRFGDLEKKLNKIKKKKKALMTVAVLLFSLTGFTQDTTSHLHNTATHTQADSIIQANAVSKEHAAEFARLVIQDNGRMKPVQTFASELLRKVSASNDYNGLDANQAFLSMTQYPRVWTQVPLISLKRGNDSIRKILGVPMDTKRITLLDLFDKDANLKIEPYLQDATSTNKPNQFQKDFIKAYESYYIFNQALSGSILKIFPVPNDEGKKWVSFPELNEANITGNDSLFSKNVLPLYFESLRNATATNDYSKPKEILDLIRNYQAKHSSEIMPSEEKVTAEILYNQVDIFNRLYTYFVLFGALMFFGIIFQIFKESSFINGFIKVCKYVIWSFFIAMTIGLIARWYISGHAPWTDAYESIIYIAWATVFFGLAFGRKSDLTIASTAFVAAIVLWVAHRNWIDPTIDTLVPVLDSYWLMIHVAVIVASYGPFTLGMILGVTALILMILTTEKNKIKMDINIKEITIITEMALTVGLVMLTIGNFLGGQWANESWGRYWGWDPKETWALISIMIYAFVIHMRLVPGLRGTWIFNFASIIAYASIMMTYFGVNFYLVGLHSYASGDMPVTPAFVYYVLSVIGVLSIISFIAYRKHYVKR
ncbi:cytochrome c biogenesis protein CcsA [Patiriisocius sp. Uisw_017]|jgi:cytochrome c-type biogenesis protein CcsB|uniref:cytochrome c biogenesis protein CcsA n=1 Tax=Patiriisocius sp. Uisw_017 TaxID=3230968 RepID=UPI0039ED79B3